MRQLLWIMLALFTASGGIAQAVAIDYINPEYGYKASIPHALPTAQTPPPAPAHGVAIALPSGGVIWLDGSYDAALHGSARAALDQVLQDASATPLQGVKKRRLAQLDAVEAAFLKEGKYALRIIALRTRGDAIPIIYTLGLDTEQQNARGDQKLFLQVARSFGLRPLPN